MSSELNFTCHLFKEKSVLVSHRYSAGQRRDFAFANTHNNALSTSKREFQAF